MTKYVTKAILKPNYIASHI